MTERKTGGVRSSKKESDTEETKVSQSATTNKKDEANTSTPLDQKEARKPEPVAKPEEKPAPESKAPPAPKRVPGMIRIKGRTAEGQMALYDRAKQHPDGHVFLYGRNEVDAWPTSGVMRAIREGRVEQI